MPQSIRETELLESFRFSVQDALERKYVGKQIATVTVKVEAAETLLQLIDRLATERTDVVRCGECKKYRTDDCPMCYASYEGWKWEWKNPEYFCSYGVRIDAGKGGGQ